MIEKYKFIILPPDGYQTTMFDRFVEARHYIQTVFDVAIKIGVPKENILVKYRTAHQKNNFPKKSSMRKIGKTERPHPIGRQQELYSTSTTTHTLQQPTHQFLPSLLLLLPYLAIFSNRRGRRKTVQFPTSLFTFSMHI